MLNFKIIILFIEILIQIENIKLKPINGFEYLECYNDDAYESDLDGPMFISKKYQIILLHNRKI